MKKVTVTELPPPAGHYSPAVIAGGFAYLSGVLPAANPTAGEYSFDAQVSSVVTRCRSILQASGCDMQDVVQCTAYIVGVERWPAFNSIYAQLFGEHLPARTVVPVPELHHGFLVEIQLIAQVPVTPRH